MVAGFELSIILTMYSFDLIFTLHNLQNIVNES